MTTTIDNLTSEEREFAAGRWDSHVRSFDRARESGNVRSAERNRRNIQELLEKHRDGLTYDWPGGFAKAD